MCVAELALPVLPGLFLGPAQKFSIVFQLEVFVQSASTVSLREQSSHSLKGPESQSTSSLCRHKASIVMLGEGSLCHLSLAEV